MKKILTSLAVSIALAGTVSQPVLAGPSPLDNERNALIQGAFGNALYTADQVTSLSQDEMSSTRGEFAPLFGVVAAIAGLDLTLIGLYWGVYVPFYGGGGTCANCGDNNISHQ